MERDARLKIAQMVVSFKVKKLAVKQIIREMKINGHLISKSAVYRILEIAGNPRR